jgi:malonate-semialdehyde dehydrogenase (acetylating)/methylmalonate-semialdehyde dehydrogenase
MTTELTHFIGGQHVKGTSGRFADVFNPATGEVQAKCPLASAAEVRAAVENAKAAQPGWAAQNPQRRARVMMKFVQLLQRDMDKLAEALSREHGKTIPDAKGDVQRGLEVAEFCIGAPHLLKGEYTESAGPGIDMYSMRQPIGVAAGITPFNFPAMIPMPDVEVLPGPGLRQRLHPETIRARPLGAADAGRTDAGSGGPSGSAERGQRRQGGGRRHPRGR